MNSQILKPSIRFELTAFSMGEKLLDRPIPKKYFFLKPFFAGLVNLLQMCRECLNGLRKKIPEPDLGYASVGMHSATVQAVVADPIFDEHRK